MGKGLHPVTRSLEVLDALKQASRELQASPLDLESNGSLLTSPAINALLELETESETILSSDPNLSALSVHLTKLKSLLRRSEDHGLIRGFLVRRVSGYSISRVAWSIENEIQAWIDRESIVNLSLALKEGVIMEEDILALLSRFERRVSQGFDLELQDLVIKSRIHHSFEQVLCYPTKHSARVREKCAAVICALVKFNKDVFVGGLVMGPLIHSLTSMATCATIRALSTLIRCIRSPFVDEIESLGEIPKILSYLRISDLDMKVIVFDCVLDIGYFGRKEAIEAMMREGLVETLIYLQRSEPRGDIITLGILSSDSTEDERQSQSHEKGSATVIVENPFASCVGRFWVQLEVGEGLRQREKRAFKLEILQRVRDACVSDAEVATIVAEVLWGSSP